MKNVLKIVVLSLLLIGNVNAEVKFEKTKHKIDDLVLQGYSLFATQLDSNMIGNGVYILTRESLTQKGQSIFHCHITMKNKKVEICYNLTPSIE